MGRNFRWLRSSWLIGWQLFLIAALANAVEPPQPTDTRDRSPATPLIAANAHSRGIETRDDIPEGTELHGVSLYYGFYKEKRRRLEDRPGTAEVDVDRPGKHVILFLSSYEPVIWDVKLRPGTTLEGIILGGYEEQRAIDRLAGTTRIFNGSGQRPGRVRIPGTWGQT